MIPPRTSAVPPRPARGSHRPQRPRAGLAFLTIALILLGMLAVPRGASAWGRTGHRAAAKMAETRLSPAALAAVKALLDPGETLADASTWADEVRRDLPESGPWHYVNVPISEPKYADRFCGESGCVVRKVADFRKTLADKTAPRAERRKALRFLVHLVQDLHQPVHVGDRHDRGGNDLQVQFFGKGSNLHRVWDSGLIEQAYPDESALLRDLTALVSAGDSAAWAGGSVVDWADESLAAARGAYQDPVTGRELRRGARLGLPYQNANLPVVRHRLARSGVRLAAVLNDVFRDEANASGVGRKAF